MWLHEYDAMVTYWSAVNRSIWVYESASNKPAIEIKMNAKHRIFWHKLASLWINEILNAPFSFCHMHFREWFLETLTVSEVNDSGYFKPLNSELIFGWLFICLHIHKTIIVFLLFILFLSHQTKTFSVVIVFKLMTWK